MCRIDPAGFNWITDRLIELRGWLDEEKEEAQTGYSECQTIGLSFHAGFILSRTYDVGITRDGRGNIGLLFTKGTGGASPSASIALFGSYASAENIFDQRGPGMQISASIGEGASVGGAYNMLLNKQGEITNHGYSVALGAGFYFPVAGEVHVAVNETQVTGFNIYDTCITVVEFAIKLFGG